MTAIYRLKSLAIQGYRPFRNFRADLGCLEVLVGANGSGKSCLFEFLKFLRDSLYGDIPPEIIAGSVGQQIFHTPGPQRFAWAVEVDTGQTDLIQYQGELVGPVGRTTVTFERVQTARPLDLRTAQSYLFMEVRGREGVLQDPESRGMKRQDIALSRPNQLALGTVTNPTMTTLYKLREYIQGWRFYSAFNLANAKIRKSVPIEQEPILHEDGGNLSAVLHYLLTEHQTVFDELQQHLKAVVPGFVGLTVKARGGPGEVIGFWRETGVDGDLSLADLSDGILRLICWIVLCLQPNPPSLICIDEPDQGVHPRTLPILSGLFEKACERTQLLIATHSSYFLTQFDLSQVAVLRKDGGEAKFLKPYDSGILRDMLTDFGPDEVERLHRSDELERLA